MLSRTAESLFWTARYMERADTIARKLEVGYRMSLLPASGERSVSEWRSILTTASSIELFDQYYDVVNNETATTFLVFDERNPNSIKNCIRSARRSGREARTAITSDVWHALNSSFQEFQKIEARRTNKLALPDLAEWVTRQSAAVRGAYINTQLDHDGACFFHLGHNVERADNTARLLDIKYHVLLPAVEKIGGGIDNFQWDAVLRAVSSKRSFRWAYEGEQSFDQVIDFLILNECCPRSLRYCTLQSCNYLDRLANQYQQKSEAQKHAHSQLKSLSRLSSKDIISRGLHEFVMRFIQMNNQLADKIGTSFLFFER